MKFLILLSLLTIVNARNLQFRPKIIGGIDADIREFPSIVSILLNQDHWCGGNLISEFWTLTAAHCRFYPDDWEVAVFEIEYGASKLLLTDENAKIAQIEKFIIHDGFDFSHVQNDVAVIKTVQPIKTGFHVPFAKLGFPGTYYPTGTPSTTAGWGIFSYENLTLPSLQKIDLQIYHYLDCRVLVKGNPLGLDVTRSQICAAEGDFKTGSCNGDSGSPLFVNGVQVGITSWGVQPCDEEQFPTVFTEVGSFIGWIIDKTGLYLEVQKFLVTKP